MRIYYNRTHHLYRVIYTEIDTLSYLATLQKADYRVRFGVVANRDHVLEQRFVPNVQIETDAGGASFVLVDSPEGEGGQMLCRDFTSLLLLGQHALDCLPWYAVKNQRWTLDIRDEDGKNFMSSSRAWERLFRAQSLKELV